jgi:hypothetical protein
MFDTDKQMARQRSRTIVPKIAIRVPYGATPFSIGVSIVVGEVTNSPLKTSPLSEILSKTNVTNTVGQISAHPLNPALTIPRKLTEWGSKDGNRKGIDGAFGFKMDIVKHGIERVRKIKLYEVHEVMSARAGGIKRRFPRDRRLVGVCNTCITAAEVKIIQTISTTEGPFVEVREIQLLGFMAIQIVRPQRARKEQKCRICARLEVRLILYRL